MLTGPWLPPGDRSSEGGTAHSVFLKSCLGVHSVSTGMLVCTSVQREEKATLMRDEPLQLCFGVEWKRVCARSYTHMHPLFEGLKSGSICAGTESVVSACGPGLWAPLERLHFLSVGAEGTVPADRATRTAGCVGTVRTEPRGCIPVSAAVDLASWGQFSCASGSM